MPLIDQAFTEHMVDDERIQPDTAFGIFHNAFSRKKRFVDPDLPRVNYKIKNHRLGDAYLREAERLIKQLNLPLEANKQEWSFRGQVFETNIEISYIK